MKDAINFIAIALILTVVSLVIYFKFKKDDQEKEEDEAEKQFEIEYLAKDLTDAMNKIINTNIKELGLDEAHTKRREEQKRRLTKAIRNCSYGDRGEKAYLKDVMKDLLQKYYDINERTIDKVIPFFNNEKLTAQDKYDILFYLYKKEYGGQAFGVLVTENNIDIEKKYDDGIYYEIDDNDIIRTYEKITPSLYPM